MELIRELPTLSISLAHVNDRVYLNQARKVSIDI